MGLGRARLVGLLLTAAAVIGLLVASSASAVTVPRNVALHVAVNGSGTVRVPGHPAFTCHASFPTSSHCRRTFQIRKGRRIVVTESPATGWKLWKWTGACHGSAASCPLRVEARRFGFVTASFVPPGDRLNPYPLGTPVSWDHPGNVGWRMTVNSATINANAQVEAVNGNVPPPAGQQYTLVNLSVTLLNGSPAPRNYFLGGLLAATRKWASIPDQSCTPPSPDLGSAGTVNSGQTETGNLCFLIFASEANKLKLTANDENAASPNDIWFALH